MHGEGFCARAEYERRLPLRGFIAVMENGKELKVEAVRFVSIVRHEIGAIRYAVTPLNFAGELTVTPYLDGDVKNKDSTMTRSSGWRYSRKPRKARAH